MLALVSDGVYANLTSAEINTCLGSSDPAAALVLLDPPTARPR
jgi:hypothetical protein